VTKIQYTKKTAASKDGGSDFDRERRAVYYTSLGFLHVSSDELARTGGGSAS